MLVSNPARSAIPILLAAGTWHLAVVAKARMASPDNGTVANIAPAVTRSMKSRRF